MEMLTPPIWAMRAWRLVAFVFFVASASGVIAALVWREWAGAIALAVSATIFGLNWNSVRHVTAVLSRRAERQRR